MCKGFRIGMSPVDTEEGEMDDAVSRRGGGRRGGEEEDVDGSGGGSNSGTPPTDMSLEMEERVVVVGVVRVITFLEDELGTICEVFERNGLGVDGEEAEEEDDKGGDEEEDEEDGGKGSPPFSPVVVNINTIAARPHYIAHPSHDQRHKHGEHAHKRVPATHLRLCDHAAGVQHKDNTKVSEHKYEVTETLKTISGVKTFHLRQPQLDKDTDPHRAARDFEIYMIRRWVLQI